MPSAHDEKTFLGTDYVQIKTNPFSIEFKKEMYIWGILTLVFLIATLTVWGVYELKRRSEEDREDQLPLYNLKA